MHIIKIYSKRKSNDKVYSNLIYEWENDFSKILNVPIYSYTANHERILNLIFRILTKLRINGLIQRIEKNRKIKKFILTYHLYPKEVFSHNLFSNKIPYIIDFDYKVDINLFNNIYSNCKLILISNLVAFNYLKEHGCKLNIQHLPLGISDNYILNNKKQKDKTYDAIITRSNKVLLNFIKQYAKENDNFEYIERRWIDNKMYSKNVYFSNKNGQIGEFSGRNEYLNLLKNSKVALYSTPGIDDDKIRFMNHVTPSLFEFISSGCRIISRYPTNEETKYFNLLDVSPNVETYDDFKRLLDKYLKDTSMSYLDKYEKYLKNIRCSNLANKLNLILKNHE